MGQPHCAAGLPVSRSCRVSSFAFDTSPWDAVTIRVPDNQGNWCHALVGAPFFLAFPMICLRLRSLFSKQLSTSIGRRLIWIAVGLSTCGTILVQVPFLLGRAGTSDWHRVSGAVTDALAFAASFGFWRLDILCCGDHSQPSRFRVAFQPLQFCTHVSGAQVTCNHSLASTLASVMALRAVSLPGSYFRIR